MAIGDDFEIQNDKDVRYIGAAHGGASPIKTFESTGSLGSAGGSATAVRTSDA